MDTFLEVIAPWAALFIFLGLVFVMKITLGEGGLTTAKKVYNYQRKQFFMTRAENIFYRELVRAVGSEYFVFAQVHLPTIVESRIRGQGWRAARAHVDRKSVDFVLCDKEFISPKLAIELDDWSHARSDRQERDREVERILEGAEVPLLRVRDAHNLEEQIREKLSPR